MLPVVDGEGDETISDFLRSLGASDEQIETARRQCRLASLAGDLVLARGATLSADELASRVGLPVDGVVSLWHTLGVVVPDTTTPMFSDRDAELTLSIVRTNPIGEYGSELLRVLGSSLARVAEAAVSLYVQTVEPSLDAPQLDMVWAKDLANLTSAALELGDWMGVIFGHHLRDAIARQRVAQTGITERSLFRLAVGFIDLVGFTPLSLHTSPSELLELIGAFEVKSFEVAAAHRRSDRQAHRRRGHVRRLGCGRGVVPSPAYLMTAGIAGVEPRGGVAFGDVITRHGDYYGTVVNLASRLADLAIPKEVLVDAATARSPATPFSFRPAGHRLLKGFDEPFEVYSLELDPDP